MEDVGIFYGHLVFFLQPYGIFYGHFGIFEGYLVYFCTVLVCSGKKNLATLYSAPSRC
jgi:hypothetical protein